MSDAVERLAQELMQLSDAEWRRLVALREALRQKDIVSDEEVGEERAPAVSGPEADKL